MSLVRDIVDAFLHPNRDPHAIPVLDGPLSPNQALDQAEFLPFDLPDADDCVVGSDGALYVSSGRRILRIADPGGASSPASAPAVWAEVEGTVGALAGLPDNGLLVAVSGLGVLRLDSRGQETGRLTQADGVPLTCVTALLVAGDRLFIANGSRDQPTSNWRQDLLGRRPASGSVLVGDARLSSAKRLLDRLAWPAGLALGDGGGGGAGGAVGGGGAGQTLWFTESWTHTLRNVRVDTAACRAVLPNLPGYPARLRRGANGDLWLALFALRTQLVELVLRETAYREAMMAKVAPELWVCPALRADLDYREVLQYGSVKKLGIQKAWSPPRAYGLVVRLSAAGEIRQSWHSRVDGRCHGVTSVCPLGGPNGDVLVVSKGHGKLARLAGAQHHTPSTTDASQ